MQTGARLLQKFGEEGTRLCDSSLVEVETEWLPTLWKTTGA